MNKTFFLTLDNENSSKLSWESNYYDVKDMLELVWSGLCNEEEARKHFDDLIKEQRKQLHELKTINKWKTIRLYDPSGKQIAQES